MTPPSARLARYTGKTNILDTVSGQFPSQEKPFKLKPPNGFTIKKETGFKYNPRTAIFCIHVKGSC